LFCFSFGEVFRKWSPIHSKMLGKLERSTIPAVLQGQAGSWQELAEVNYLCLLSPMCVLAETLCPSSMGASSISCLKFYSRRLRGRAVFTGPGLRHSKK
jgi:hypothetical protein